MNAVRTEKLWYILIFNQRTRSVYICYVLGTESVLKKGHCDDTRVQPQRDHRMYTWSGRPSTQVKTKSFHLRYRVIHTSYWPAWLHESLDNSKIYSLIYYWFYFIDVLYAIHNRKLVYSKNIVSVRRVWVGVCACDLLIHTAQSYTTTFRNGLHLDGYCNYICTYLYLLVLYTWKEFNK